MLPTALIYHTDFFTEVIFWVRDCLGPLPPLTWSKPQFYDPTRLPTIGYNCRIDKIKVRNIKIRWIFFAVLMVVNVHFLNLLALIRGGVLVVISHVTDVKEDAGTSQY